MPNSSTSSSSTPKANGHAKPASSTPSSSPNTQHSTNWSLFRIPQPIKRLFDAFPLKTYPANSLPLRSTQLQSRQGHALFVWCSERDVHDGRASFNPHCLRWQTYLKSRGIQFHIVPSSNHSSTSGRLPFLVVNDGCELPLKLQGQDGKWLAQGDIVSAGELARWASEDDDGDAWPRELDALYEPYMSLLNNEIRRAWTYHMYQTANFNLFTLPSYIGTHSSSAFIHFLSSHQLRNAASSELSKQSPKLDIEALYNSAERAFYALNNLIIRRRKLSSSSKTLRAPTLLETTLFAYLFLLLEVTESKWADDRLVKIVRKFDGLVDFYRDTTRELKIKAPTVYEA